MLVPIPRRLAPVALLLVAQIALPPIVALAADDYKLGPDAQPQPGVPEGTITQGVWTSEKVFPGTQRDYWIYVPRQYDAEKPACVMVFQDGRIEVCRLRLQIRSRRRRS